MTRTERAVVRAQHPMQPIVRDRHGVFRFKENKIVRAFYEAASNAGVLDLNRVACMNFSREDAEHFAQLIGYSVSGFGDLSYTRRKTVKTADDICARLAKQQKRRGK